MKSYFELARPVAVLFSPNLKERMEVVKSKYIEEQCSQDSRIAFISVDIVSSGEIVNDNYDVGEQIGDLYDNPGSLFFTSGTSGKRKGVVHSYGALLASARERILTWNLGRNDVVLNQKPANWMGGIFGILPSLISGARL
jgi:acyl-coenzyme A synthetase/AMP-(fatty) acid ligase